MRQHGESIFIEEFGAYIEEETGKKYIDEHALMTDHYVEPMIKFLKDYDSLYGRSAPDTYYRALAMSGLEEYISNDELNALMNAQNYFRNLGLNCN